MLLIVVGEKVSSAAFLEQGDIKKSSHRRLLPVLGIVRSE